MQNVLDAIQQAASLDRLLDHLVEANDGSAPPQAFRHVTGQQDCRTAAPLHSQLCKKLEPVHLRHMVVEHQTIRLHQVCMRQQPDTVLAGLHRETIEPQAETQRLSDSKVVVNDQDERTNFSHAARLRRKRRVRLDVDQAGVI